MSQSKISQNLLSYNKKMAQPLPSSPTDDLPQFLVRAGAAAQTGQIEQATHLLNDQAVKIIREITENNPSRTDVIFLLATVFYKTGQLSKAEQWYKKILKQGPNAPAYNKLACICQYTGRLSEAMQYQRNAVQTDPKNAEYQANLARILMETGKTQEGIDLLRKTIEKMPKNPVVHSNFLFRLHHLPDPNPQMLFDEHKRWGDIHASPTRVRLSHDNIPDPDRKLRIGYISPDFRSHPVACFFESLLDGHDRRVVEVYGYSNVERPDEITKRLKSKFDHYQNIRGVSDEAAAGMIEQDQIDILVDIAGHTADNRLLVLAYKPAPIQVTYLGYPDTTGMHTIDYRLTDRLTNPPDSQKFYTEELVFLPETFACYRPPDYAGPVTPLPAAKNGCVTFGSFNNKCKIHPFIMTLWAEILKADKNHRLLLRFKGGDDQEVKNHYFHHFERLGILREKVEICGWRNPAEHLQSYGRVDIALDTYPLNGHTTTCEALWMGVPVISLVGKCHGSRLGLSVLSSIHLEFFAAATPREYVAKAAALAANRQALEKIRSSMRARIATSGLCCAKGFARGLEDAYRKMWHRWCRHQGTNIPTAAQNIANQKGCYRT